MYVAGNWIWRGFSPPSARGDGWIDSLFRGRESKRGGGGGGGVNKSTQK